jgi:threonine dehydrogenase-like Zn-dependent dehydrogenase
MGHEGSGIVEAVGSGVRGFQKGDPVTSTAGQFADYFVSGADALVKLPKEVDPVWAMGEPLACVFHAARRFGIDFGDRVAILGSGFMGLICLQAALLRGPGYVCAMDPVSWRLEVAKRLGADEVHDPKGQSGKDLVERFGEFDVVIEAAGTASAIDMATDLVKQHGRIVLVGYHTGNDGMRTVNMALWNFKAIDVVNGHVRRQHEKREAMRASVELLRAGRLHTADLVTTYPLAKVGDAFQDLVNVKEGLFKVALVP